MLVLEQALFAVGAAVLAMVEKNCMMRDSEPPFCSHGHAVWMLILRFDSFKDVVNTLILVGQVS